MVFELCLIFESGAHAGTGFLGSSPHGVWMGCFLGTPDVGVFRSFLLGWCDSVVKVISVAGPTGILTANDPKVKLEKEFREDFSTFIK